MANKSGVGIGIFWPTKSSANNKNNYKDEFTSGFVRLYIFFQWVLTKLGYAKAEFPIITRPICKSSVSNIAFRPREFGGVLRDEPLEKCSLV